MSEEFNTLGDVFKEQVVHSKEGKKITKLKEQLEESKVILKSLVETDTVDEAKAKVVVMLKVLYSRHHLENQMGYLAKKRTTPEVMKQAYNNYLMKSESLDKMERKLTED